MPVEELAKKANVSCDALYRVMRMLAGYDFFNETKPRYFENTELSFYLTKDHPDSFRDSVIYRIELGSESWNNLLYSLKTGKPAFDKIFGAPFFQYLAENPEKSEIFNKAMVAQYRKNFHNILENYDFSFCNTLVDIGGGRGYFASEFLKKYTNAKAILFDLQSVIDEYYFVKLYYCSLLIVLHSSTITQSFCIYVVCKVGWKFKLTGIGNITAKVDY